MRDVPEVKMIRLDKIVPMPEVERQYYSPFIYKELKNVIEKDGFDPSCAIRVLWNRRLEQYECFDGLHRLKIEKELGLRSSIPAIDETRFLTRTMAVAKGIIANNWRAQYNVLDLAKSVKALGESLVKDQTRNIYGRPKVFDEKEIARITHFSQQRVSQLLQILKLPEEVQGMIGQGKLKFTHSLALTRLVGTRHENKILELAENAITHDWSRSQLVRAIEAVKHTGFFDGELRCDSCRRIMPSDSISRPHLCPSCMGKLHSGELDRDRLDSHNEARRRYLKLRSILERHYPDNTVPEHFKTVLETFHEKWNGNSKGSEGFGVQQ